MENKKQLQCKKCAHVWEARALDPIRCTKCKSPDWSHITLPHNRLEHGGKVTHSNKGQRG